MRTTSRLHGPGRIAAAGLMLLLWLGLLALASSAELHHALHPDSHQLSHECLLTSFNRSHLLFACVSVAVAMVVVVRWQPQLPGAAAPDGPLDLRLRPSRAPPSPSFFTSVR